MEVSNRPYPSVEIKIDRILENARTVQGICREHGIRLSMVTKVLSDNLEVVSRLVDAGIDCICEARIDNLISYRELDVEKWLIRIPMLSEVKDVVRFADASLNSEMETVRALNREAAHQHRVHNVILMYELGDLREGMMRDELMASVREFGELKNVHLYGLGVNLSCYGQVLPSERNMAEFRQVVRDVEEEIGRPLEIVSGGNSTSMEMLVAGTLPPAINNLRMGEAIFFGNLPCKDRPIDFLNRDNFVLRTQIIELKEKPSMPWGNQGDVNALGVSTQFVDRGVRKRALVALGRQDVNLYDIQPLDKQINVLGCSSDHTILDVTDSERDYKLGDIVEFRLDYAGLLALMTTKHVSRKIV